MSTTVLNEPFNNLTAWTLGSGAIIATSTDAPAGTFARITGSSSQGYPIAFPSPFFDIEFWYRPLVGGGGVAHSVLLIRSDTVSVNEMTLQVGLNNELIWKRGGVTGAALLTTNNNVVTANAWKKIRVVGQFADNGSASIYVDGALQVSISNTKTYFSVPSAASVWLTGPGATYTNDWDELTLKTGGPVPTPKYWDSSAWQVLQSWPDKEVYVNQAVPQPRGGSLLWVDNDAPGGLAMNTAAGTGPYPVDINFNVPYLCDILVEWDATCYSTAGGVQGMYVAVDHTVGLDAGDYWFNEASSHKMCASSSVLRGVTPGNHVWTVAIAYGTTTGDTGDRWRLAWTMVPI